MQQLTAGANLVLSQSQCQIKIKTALPTQIELDVSAYLLNVQNKVRGDADMIFYGQKRSPNRSVELIDANSKTPYLAQFNVNTQLLDSDLNKVAICATIDGQSAINAIQNIEVELWQNGQLSATATVLSAEKTEKALILVEVYRYKEQWKFRFVNQGFNGGLKPLSEYFGIEISDEQPIPDIEIAPIQPKPLNLSKISLDKAGQTHRIDLTKKEAQLLTVEATWVDNGDDCDNNDDLDLRVGLLIYGEKEMQYIFAPHQQGSLDHFPYIRHLGDVTSATINQPATERVEVNIDIAKKIGRKVGLVFSVYSAISNGVVSIASLQPRMKMQYGEQVVECIFNPSVSPAAKSRFIYTYVIGLAIIDETGVTLQYSGMTSSRFSESTPRLIWKDHQLSVKVDGEPFFK